MIAIDFFSCWKGQKYLVDESDLGTLRLVLLLEKFLREEMLVMN